MRLTFLVVMAATLTVGCGATDNGLGSDAGLASPQATGMGGSGGAAAGLEAGAPMGGAGGGTGGSGGTGGAAGQPDAGVTVQPDAGHQDAKVPTPADATGYPVCDVAAKVVFNCDSNPGNALNRPLMKDGRRCVLCSNNREPDHQVFTDCTITAPGPLCVHVCGECK